MGILDQVTGALSGGKGGSQAVLLQQVIGMLGKPGAIGNLTSAFQQQGLGNTLQSWLSTGQNLPISASQVQKVLGDSTLTDMAKKAGISTPDAANALSTLLPQVIDKISPDGNAPAANNLGSLLGSVGKLLG